MDYLTIGIELLVGFIALMLVTKLIGKTQITQITAFDFISALVLGEFVGNALYDEETGIAKILFAISAWGLLMLIAESITQKSLKLRYILEGKPVIVIHKGKIMYNALKRNRLDLNQLQQLLRAKDVFSIQEVMFAILETDGSVSVQKKSSFATPTLQDLNAPLKDVNLPVALVLDGEIVKENLSIAQVDEDWVESEIQKMGYHKVTDVLFAEWEQGKNLYVQGYN